MVTLSGLFFSVTCMYFEKQLILFDKESIVIFDTVTLTTLQMNSMSASWPRDLKRRFNGDRVITIACASLDMALTMIISDW